MKTNSYAVPEGCKITSVDFNTGIVVYESVEPQFKKGDFVFCKGECQYIAIFKDGESGYFNYFARIYANEELGFNSYSTWLIERLATPEEKQLLIDKMRENGKDWSEEKCEVVDYVEMIEEGQSYWYLSIGEDGVSKDFEQEAGFKRHYGQHRFKTKQLSQIACVKLNETLKTLKHY